MGKQSFFLAQIEAKYQKKLEEIQAEYDAKLQMERHFARVFQMDLVTLSLGRLGWREKRLSRLDEMLTAVVKELGDDARAEMEYDPDLWKSRADFDRELKLYAGSRYVPYEERYRI